MRSISFSLCLAIVLVLSVVSSVAGHSRSRPSSATATVEIGKQIAEVWPRIFRGFTADWWRHNDPGNGDRWQWAGMLTLDLSNARLRNLTKALAPAIWRIGGTTEDEVVYVIGDPPECATPEAINKSINYPGPLCLTMQRWGEIIEFVNYTGVKLAFGLNGLYQRHHHHGSLQFHQRQRVSALHSQAKDFQFTRLSCQMRTITVRSIQRF